MELKTISKIRAAFVGLGLLSVLGPTATGQDAPVRIKNQINHLRQTVESEPVSNQLWKEAKPGIAMSLLRAEDALRAGRLYASLEELASALDSLRGTESATQKTEEKLLKEGRRGVESDLLKIRLGLTAFEKQAAQKNWDTAPIAIRALAEKAQGQTRNLLEGGRAFASVTDVEKTALAGNYASALYYAGEARGQAEFAAFCYTLDLPRKTSAFPLRSIMPELQQLQTHVTDAYSQPGAVNDHAFFIRLNATLKLAQELDAARLFAGALYLYPDATQQFAVLDTETPSGAKQSELRKSLDEMRAQLDLSPQDASIAQLFLERAESELARAPAAAAWIEGETIVGRLLPAYMAVSKVSAASEQPSPAGVIVTLVRWPYT